MILSKKIPDDRKMAVNWLRIRGAWKEWVDTVEFLTLQVIKIRI
jgi:hypothetical protein